LKDEAFPATIIAMTNPAIRVENLSFSWPEREPLFDSLGFDIERGEAFAIVGASGSGKSSLLALLAGLERPASGKILVDGRELERPRPRTGLVLQDHGLLPWATIRDNVSLGSRLRRFYGPDGRHAPSAASEKFAQLERSIEMESDTLDRSVEGWLERLGIASIADAWPARVSGGQRQRAAIARSLALEPDLLLMDEAFASLDEATREDLRALTLEIREERGMTLVLVTHSIDEALIVGDRILLLEGPRVSAGDGDGRAAMPPSSGVGTRNTGGGTRESGGPTPYRIFDNPRGETGKRGELKANLRAALGASA
jgi:NitT/TauT family transport system ATP-binding protein